MNKAFKKDHSQKIKLNRSRWIASFILLIISFAVLIASRKSTAFADWFGFNVYPIFSGIGSRLWGLLVYIKHKQGQRKKALLNGLSYAVLFSSAVFCLVTLNCLSGYSRTPFSAYSGLEVTEYSPEELRGLTLALAEKANEAVNEVELDEEGHPVKPSDFNALAVKAMEDAAEKYPVLQSYYPQPKGVMASDIMSSFNLAGIYFPVTVEANYNQSMPVSSQGFTACHELSHLSGFIREDEANYIAFTACRGSESAYFRYSGYLDALTYALNAYRGVASDEEYYEIISGIKSEILNEYSYRNEYWAPFRKKVTYKVSSTVNDAYLKANNQTDGTRSYGRIVDLMLAEWKANGSKL